jgi:hypothetical protein
MSDEPGDKTDAAPQKAHTKDEESKSSQVQPRSIFSLKSKQMGAKDRFA